MDASDMHNGLGELAAQLHVIMRKGCPLAICLLGLKAKHEPTDHTW